MNILTLILSLLSLALTGYLILQIRKNKAGQHDPELKKLLATIEPCINRFESVLKDELTRSRGEAAQADKAARVELIQSFQAFTASLTKQIIDIANLQKDQIVSIATHINHSNKETKDELSNALKSFEGAFNLSTKDLNEGQKQKLDSLHTKQTELIQTIETRLEKMREIVEGKLKLMQEDNNEKLEKMRATVDEKLHHTLETRLGQSFKLVTDKLDLVHKGLGEMQVLATGVGDLKKVLSNVKTRGVLGEYQLANLLEQLLTSEQYQKNIKTKAGSEAIVEFAIKLPGREDKSTTLLLPIE